MNTNRQCSYTNRLALIATLSVATVYVATLYDSVAIRLIDSLATLTDSI